MICHKNLELNIYIQVISNFPMKNFLYSIDGLACPGCDTTLLPEMRTCSDGLEAARKLNYGLAFCLLAQL